MRGFSSLYIIPQKSFSVKFLDVLLEFACAAKTQKRPQAKSSEPLLCLSFNQLTDDIAAIAVFAQLDELGNSELTVVDVNAVALCKFVSSELA